MIALNLKTKNTSQEMVKAYLEKNASEALAEKIMSGIRIEKDGKQLISRKDLDSFWAYATKEAQALKEQYIDNDTVYGWAIHYFEEDSIEGKLYNEDGTEYKPTPVPVKKSTIPTYTPPAPKPKPQMSIFDDLLDTKKTETTAPIPEKKESAPQPKISGKSKTSPFYEHYLSVQKKNLDCIIVYRLGDFYEILGDNAVSVAEQLNLTLTSRDVGLPERVPMIGFPYHAADAYIAKLIERGCKIAIVENLKERVIESSETPEIVADEETGEVLCETPQEDNDELYELDTNAFDTEALAVLDELFGDEIILR